AAADEAAERAAHGIGVRCAAVDDDIADIDGTHRAAAVDDDARLCWSLRLVGDGDRVRRAGRERRGEGETAIGGDRQAFGTGTERQHETIAKQADDGAADMMGRYRGFFIDDRYIRRIDAGVVRI